jgi:hypothetical protein
MLVGAATLVCGTHLFLLATSDWDSATLAIEPSPPTTATISIELSALSKPTRPVAELKVAAAPVAEQPSLPSKPPQFTASTEVPPQVVTEEQPPIAAEARVGDQTPLASASGNLSVAPASKDSALAAPEPTSSAPDLASAAPEATWPARELSSSTPSETAAAVTESAGDDAAENIPSEGPVAPANDGKIAQASQQAP